MKHRITISLATVLAACVIWAAKPVGVIIETDMGNDIDDAIAMDLAYKAMDDGLVNILAVGVHKLSPTSADYIDILNTWYGYGSIPVARSLTPVYDSYSCDYTLPVCAMRDADGHPLWKRSLDGGDIEEPVTLYRRILAAQPDSSVVFISLGFGTELAKLLESAPDAISPLDGVELLRQKVKFLSVMAGSYNGQPAEYNVTNDIPAMQKVFALWPAPIVQNPFELGDNVMFSGDRIDGRFSWAGAHPVVEGYKRFLPMPYNRQTWDLHSVIYVTNPEMYSIEGHGTVRVTDDGHTVFTPDANGNVTILTATPGQRQALERYIAETTGRKPRHFCK